MRRPRRELYDALLARGTDLEDAGIAAVSLVGDSLAPGAIVHAVHSGHRFAREFDAPAEPGGGETAYLRDFPL
jgi:dimethylamine/trimethylamine dehydrogenase